MSDDGPPEREVKDFFFKLQGKVRVNPTPESVISDRVSLVTVSNKYGLIFVGTPQGFRVLRQVDLSQRLQDYRQAAPLEDFPFWTTIYTGGALPHHLAVSADSLTLAVCVTRAGLPVALFYDVRAFADKDTAAGPFMEAKLSSATNTDVVDFAWNPGAEFSSIFALCTSDGVVSLWEVGASPRNVASLPAGAGGKALCWSPKGKQVVVGKHDGSLVQYDQQLKPKKVIPAPSLFQSGSMAVLDVLWQSTHVFIVSFAAANGDVSEQPCLVIVNVPKGESANYVKYDDICYGSGEDRKHKYYILQIPEWDISAMASANALEAAVIGRHPEVKTVWERWSLEDSGRAELPLTDDYNETMPTGLAVSLTSSVEIPLGDNMVHPPSPLFVLLSTDGVLISFHMVNQRPGAASLNHAPEALSATGARPPMAVPASTSTLQASTPAAAPAPTSTTIASSKPSVFASLTLGQNTSTPAKSLTFGQVPPEGAAPTGSTASGSAPFSLQSTNAASFSFNKALAQSGVASQSLANQAAVTQSSGGTPSFIFGAKPTSSSGTTDQANAAAMPANSSALAPSFAFKPAATTPAMSNTPVSLVKPSPAPSVATTPATPSNVISSAQATKPITTAQPAPLPTQVANTPSQPTSTTATTTTTVGVMSKASSAFSASQMAAGAKRAQMPVASGNTQQSLTPTPQTSGGSPQSRPTLKPQTTARRSLETPANTVDNPFTKSIIDEMMHFNQEVKELLTRCKSVDELSVGADNLKENLRLGTEKMTTFCSELKETMQSLNSDITNLRSQTLESYALLEEIQIRRRRDKDPAYQHLLQSRSLDPASAHLMKSIQSQCHYVESSIRSVDLRLDTEWEQYQRSKQKAKMIRTPATDAIYQTLRNNNNILNSQTHAIDQLVNELQEMRLVNTTSAWQPDHTAQKFHEKGHGLAESSPLKNSPAEVGLSPSARAQISPEKQARLRDILSKRKVTPVKSTAPANLSMSKIVSASSLRQMLLEEEEEEEYLQTPPCTPPRFSAVPPRTVQVSPQPQQAITKPTASLKPSAKSPGLVSLLQSPNSALKPIPKPAAAAGQTKASPTMESGPKPVTSALKTGTTPVPQVDTKPAISFSTVAPPGNITIGQSAAFQSGSLGGPRITQERPTDPAAKVISQNAETGGFSKVATSKPLDLVSGGKGTGGLGQAGFAFQGSGGSTSGAGTAPSFSFGGSSSSTFSFGAANNSSTAAKSNLSFGGAASTPATITQPTAPSKTVDTSNSEAEPNLKSVESEEKPCELEEAEQILSVQTEDWEMVTNIVVDITEPTTYEDLTPPETPSQQETTQGKITESKDPNTGSTIEKGVKPNIFGFGQPSKDVSTTIPGAFFGAGKPVQKEAQTTVVTNAQVTSGDSMGSTKPAFTFGTTASGSTTTPSVIAAPSSVSKKETEQAAPPTAPTTTGLFNLGASTTAKPSFAFGAATSSSGTFTFGAASSAAAGGDATSTTIASKPAFGFSGSSTSTAAPTFGATVVSGTGAATSSAASSIPASSWKPIVSANSSISGGSLTSGTPVFGSAAQTCSSSTVTTVSTGTTSTAAPVNSSPKPVVSSEAAVSAEVSSESVTSTSTSQPSPAPPAPPPAVPSQTSTTTPSAKPLFGKQPESAAPASTTVVKSLFGQPVASSSAFGTAVGSTVQPSASPGVAEKSTANTANSSTETTATSAATSAAAFSFAAAAAVAASTAASASTTTASLFGKPAGGGLGLFGNATTTTTTQPTASIFSAAASTSSATGTGLFGSTTSTGLFGNQQTAAATSTTTTTSTSLFGSTSAAGQTTSSAGGSQLFSGSSTAATVGGSAPLFGGSQATTSASTFGQPGGSLFSGSTAASTASSTFGQTSGFGTPSFGSTPGTFASQPLFGGTTTSSTSVFGQPTTPATTASGGLFSSAAGSGGGFFSGLGGKPSTENANKNVFGSTTFGGGASSGTGSGLFGSSSSSTGFSGGGAFRGSGSGPFSAGGSSQSGSVASTGFGGFTSQPASPPNNRGGFGAAPSFGGSPSFGSPPAFGSSPGFGTAASASPFGTVPATGNEKATQSAGFANFASSSAPTFGGIAQQSGPSFGSISQQPSGGAGFGSPGGSVFGSSPGFGGSTFGASPGFGGATSPSNPSFTSYRS